MINSRPSQANEEYGAKNFYRSSTGSASVIPSRRNRGVPLQRLPVAPYFLEMKSFSATRMAACDETTLLGLTCTPAGLCDEGLAGGCEWARDVTF